MPLSPVLQGRRRDRRLDGARLREVEEIVLVDGRLQRRALLDEIRHQLAQRLRVHHRAGEDVRADGRALLDDADLNLAERLARLRPGGDRLVVLRHEAREVQRAAQVRRAGPDEDHVHLQTFAFHQFSPLTLACRSRRRPRRETKLKMNGHSVSPSIANDPATPKPPRPARGSHFQPSQNVLPLLCASSASGVRISFTPEALEARRVRRG
jgi:hypothetical protein